MVAYMRRHTQSLEAGVKYLILGALSTGFLVYGITWIFGVTGHTHLASIRDALLTGFRPHEGGALVGNEAAVLFGVMLVLVGLGFKVAAAPFQLWVPDVYQGAPTPVTAFLSVGSKAAGFIVLVRVLEVFLPIEALRGKVILVLVIIAAATLIYGNLTAMPQDNVKRLFAYSSIAHAGYLLMACASLGADPIGAKEAVSFYLAGYLLMTLLSFLVLIVVARHSRGDDLRHFNGLGKRSPLLAFGMTLAIASLAGIPLTAGFLGKFLVFKSAVAAGHYTLLVIGIIAVGAGFYYYLRVITAMYWNEPGDGTPIKLGPLTRFSVVILSVGIVVFGIWPKPLLSQLKDSSARVVPAKVVHVAKQ
jgi:NADH-quinone oxidoreductase subunit N